MIAGNMDSVGGGRISMCLMLTRLLSIHISASLFEKELAKCLSIPYRLPCTAGSDRGRLSNLIQSSLFEPRARRKTAPAYDLCYNFFYMNGMLK